MLFCCTPLLLLLIFLSVCLFVSVPCILLLLLYNCIFCIYFCIYFLYLFIIIFISIIFFFFFFLWWPPWLALLLRWSPSIVFLVNKLFSIQFNSIQLWMFKKKVSTYFSPSFSDWRVKMVKNVIKIYLNIINLKLGL